MPIMEIGEDTFIAFGGSADNINLIRGLDAKLLHICERSHGPGGESLLKCGKVLFSFLEGQYECLKCRQSLDAEEVMSDGVGIGQEGHA